MPDIPDLYAAFLALTFVVAVNAFLFSAAMRTQNTWTPFIVGQILAAVAALGMEAPGHGAGQTWLLVAMLVAVAVVYWGLWRREDRMRSEGDAEARRHQREFFEKNKDLIEARHARARSNRWRR